MSLKDRAEHPNVFKTAVEALSIETILQKKKKKRTRKQGALNQQKSFGYLSRDLCGTFTHGTILWDASPRRMAWDDHAEGVH